MGKRELIALLNLSSCCLVMVERLFLAVPRGCLQFVIVVFPDHTHLLFFTDWEQKWGMLFHPDKCNSMQVTRSRNPLTFSLKGQGLEAVNTAKYLGVDLSNNLSWNNHIDRTAKKANSMLGFLRRNICINNRNTKAAAAAYKELVRPNLEYCASVWSPYTATGKQNIEMVQRRAARYATNRYHNTSSVTDMLQKNLDWESLESRRVKMQLTLLFKVIQDLVDIPSAAYLTPASQSHEETQTDFIKVRCLQTQFLPSSHPSLEFFAGHRGRGPWLGILQAGALNSYILS